MNAISALWNKILQAVTIINFPWDILDILIVTFLIYQILRLSRSRSSAQVIKAVIALLVLSYVSSALNLYTLNYLVSKVIEVGVIALVVVFQPELRRMMERLGGSSLKGLLAPKNQSGDTARTMVATVEACRSMSRQKIGALIVFEREDSLDDYFKTGTILNADVSAELLKNIFFPKAALHDGAVVIRDDRIAAAGCVLPLTENPNLSRDLGTRHRAAIGMSENSDALVVVVSEETGVISCAQGGRLRRYMTPETLEDLLMKELVEQAQTPAQGKISKLLNKLRKGNKKSSHEEN